MEWLRAVTSHWMIGASWLLAGLVIATYWLVRRSELRESHAGRKLLADLGTDNEDAVPLSLHPYVDPSRCIGSGACIKACPEHNVLQIVDGLAHLVNPLACVGHSACAAACGMDAIRLVFGAKHKGVRLPKLSESFETTSPGVFVVGELAGMGLIRNALRQGTAAGESIARSARSAASDALDAIIVGAGPAGTGAALTLLQAKRRFMLLDREAYGGTIAQYPRGKVVMTGDLEFPGYGRVRKRRMSREQLVELWHDLREKTQLPITTGALVTGLARERDGMWRVESSQGAMRAAHVILALGRRGSPRKLEVPGEDLPKVSYRLLEPEEHHGKHVMVVGGGNSAIETALVLADYGGCASVSLSYRRERFARARAENLSRIQHALTTGAVIGYLGTQIGCVTEQHVALRMSGGRDQLVENDSLIVQAGGTDPTALLESFGVALEVRYGEVS